GGAARGVDPNHTTRGAGGRRRRARFAPHQSGAPRCGYIAANADRPEASAAMEQPAPADGAARWEHFPHLADIGVRGLGPTKEAAFEQAAVALTAALT